MLVDARFQETKSFYIDAESMIRSNNVKDIGEFSDSFISLVVGKEWQLDTMNMKFLASVGGKYSNVNYFEQDFDTNLESKQHNIFSATAQAGVIVPIGRASLISFA